ncbi:hypothetical protein M0R36_11250 [bacterium]|jgi:hypothetical protein|nr:hypothetical protein [bacterium]
MTKDELIKRLNEIKDEGGGEGGHMEADDLLLEYINDPDISKAFNEIERWYS